MARAECVLPCANRLGEGPIWDGARGLLFWVDIVAPAVHAFDPARGEHRTWSTPEHVGCLSVRKGGGLVLALQNGFVALDLETGEFQTLAAVEADQPDQRFNDGRCDRQGRFFAGSLAYGEDRPAGTLWRLDGDHTATPVMTGLTVPNSLAWSPAGRIMYFADTPTREIKAYPYDIEAGRPGEGRLFRRVDDSPGWPDGSTVDSEGCLWNCEWDGARVVRYTPGGEVDRVVDLPARRATCCAFGGSDLKTLFITTAWDRMSDAERGDWPQSGHLFALPVDVPGLPDPLYEG